MLTDEHLAAITARVAAATPGPWETDIFYDWAPVNDGSPGWQRYWHEWKPWGAKLGIEEIAPGTCVYCQSGPLVETGHAALRLGEMPLLRHLHRIPDTERSMIWSAATHEEVVSDHEGGNLVEMAAADAQFIAQSRRDVPLLLSTVQELEAARSSAEFHLWHILDYLQQDELHPIERKNMIAWCKNWLGAYRKVKEKP